MQKAAGALEGTHDFAAFRGAPGGSPEEEGTQRTLNRLEVVREGDQIQITAESRGFLRYMVRNLVGTLVAVGQGRLAVSQIPELLESRDRSRASPTAPAHGLCLERVTYPS
jgi:tRNA pseudouridine38-40 synthase